MIEDVQNTQWSMYLESLFTVISIHTILEATVIKVMCTKIGVV